ncbi:MAG: deoxyribodipyrimidine photo-lyase [Gemmatimonadota bacterium]|jgi:deoxyribodipyrimidine photo-lyase
MTPIPTHGVPALRLRGTNGATANGEGEFVLYWMTAARRLRYNWALQLAAAEARARGRPLLVLEALRAGHRWASDRLHRFVLDGMVEHARQLEDTGVAYYPYVEPEHGDGHGLLETLAARSVCVVTDEYPAYFLPRMLEAVAPRLRVPLVAVDSNGLLPVRAAGKSFTAAYHFRRFLQRNLADHLFDAPEPDPLRTPLPAGNVDPGDVAERWPPATIAWLESGDSLRDVAIDHGVAPVPIRGGEAAARAVLRSFLRDRLARYGEARNHPDANAASGLSPWLHWGHLSVHEVFSELARHENWSPARLAPRADGRKQGWWGMSAPAEAFLDELVTWREIGFVECARRNDYDRYESLPEWARATLADHGADPRDRLYSLEQFEAAETHDPLWNAAQRELLREGRIHNYLRMLWGKKILEWTESPREALAIMIELNNRYATDGRDPNSYSGIFWCLGRYDRPWPERAIYGKVRSMSSDSTRRKVRLDGYLRKYGTG